MAFEETCRHVIPINFKNHFVKFPPGKPRQMSDVPNPEGKKKSTNLHVHMLFQKNGHVFPFRVNYSKLEERISTIISKN